MSMLDRAQQSALTIALRHLELVLARVEVLLAGPQEGLLYRTVTDLSPDQTVTARRLIGELRDEMTTMVYEFGLTPDAQDGRREIIGRLAIAWEGLEDARSTKLGRYGVVDPTLAARLDPHIDRLVELVLALERHVQTRA